MKPLDCYEDWDFWLQASLLGNFVFTPGISGYYRIHHSSGVHRQETFYGTTYTAFMISGAGRWPTEHLAKLMNTYWHMHIARTRWNKS